MNRTPNKQDKTQRILTHFLRAVGVPRYDSTWDSHFTFEQRCQGEEVFSTAVASSSAF